MNTLNKLFKPYHLVDNSGTNKRFKTLKQASAWLPYAGSVAVIGKGGKAIMQRIQGATL